MFKRLIFFFFLLFSSSAFAAPGCLLDNVCIPAAQYVGNSYTSGVYCPENGGCYSQNCAVYTNSGTMVDATSLCDLQNPNDDCPNGDNSGSPTDGECGCPTGQVLQCSDSNGSTNCSCQQQDDSCPVGQVKNAQGQCVPQEQDDDCSAWAGGDLSGNPRDGSCTCPAGKDQISTGCGGYTPGTGSGEPVGSGSCTPTYFCVDKCANNQLRHEITKQCYDICPGADLSGSPTDSKCDCPAMTDFFAGACLPNCPSGQYRNPNTGNCVDRCPTANSSYDSASNQCNCQQGYNLITDADGKNFCVNNADGGCTNPAGCSFNSEGTSPTGSTGGTGSGSSGSGTGTGTGTGSTGSGSTTGTGTTGSGGGAGLISGADQSYINNLPDGTKQDELEKSAGINPGNSTIGTSTFNIASSFTGNYFTTSSGQLPTIPIVIPQLGTFYIVLNDFASAFLTMKYLLLVASLLQGFRIVYRAITAD